MILRIPKTITLINHEYFEARDDIEEVHFESPSSLTSIGQLAFERCTSLRFIDLPQTVTSIEWQAFYECTSLTAIDLPLSLTSIGRYAFHGC